MNELTLPVIPTIIVMICSNILILISVSLYHVSKNIKKNTKLSEELQRVRENNDIFRKNITENIKQLEKAYNESRGIYQRELSMYNDILTQIVEKTDVMIKFIETKFSEKDQKFYEIDKIMYAVKDIKTFCIALTNDKSNNT